MTLSNLACDIKYTRHKVAEVSAEVTPTRAVLVNHSSRKDQGMLGRSRVGVCVCTSV